MKSLFTVIFLFIACLGLYAQRQTDSNTPLHLLQPAYKTPYGKQEVKDVVAVLDKVYNYLNENTRRVW